MDVENDVERNVEHECKCKDCCSCTPTKMAVYVLAVVIIGK